MDRPDGCTVHFEGAQDVERKVRMDHFNGCVVHLEGERGDERKAHRPAPRAFTSARRHGEANSC